jgi:hypothetical protein
MRGKYLRKKMLNSCVMMMLALLGYCPLLFASTMKDPPIINNVKGSLKKSHHMMVVSDKSSFSSCVDKKIEASDTLMSVLNLTC